MSLPRELALLQERVELLSDEYGLTTFPVVFEMVDYAQMNQLAAYTGFPVRYPHWRWGMEYEQLSKSYEYGLHKIYEMVINNDPTYAYLLEGNEFIDQKLVIAHVYGHADFFKNNVYFSHTNRKMVDAMANHATRIRRYRDKEGIEAVETFVDACLALETLIDPSAAFDEYYGLTRRDEEDDEVGEPTVGRLPSKAYMENYVNPPEALEAERAKIELAKRRRKMFPSRPQRDVLAFLLRHAPLEGWEHDILGIIREESYYFLPQRQTKIMNEGWASYWHTKLLTKHLLDADEVISYADHHSGTTATQQGKINPYKLGIELFRHIEERWDAGKFGHEWDSCDDMTERLSWDKKTGLGYEKIFQIRQVHCDLTFLDEFLTEDFCREHKLFVFGQNRRKEVWEIQSRQFEQIKQTMLFQLTNAGTPIIEVVDGNYRNRRELLLVHRHDGIDLKIDWAKEVLVCLARIWQRPVFLETVIKGRARRLGFDGNRHVDQAIRDVAAKEASEDKDAVAATQP